MARPCGGPHDSLIELCFDWYRAGPEGRSRVAFGRMRVGWVKIVDRYTIEPAPLPSFFRTYMERILGMSAGESVVAEVMPSVPPELDPGEVQFRYRGVPGGEPSLSTLTIQTSQGNSNLIGNVYFANYPSWQGRVRDLYSSPTRAAVLRRRRREGEWVCVNAEVQHLREAMPFDEILVVMGLRELSSCGVKLHFEYFKVDDHGTRMKLAIAQHDAVWVRRGEDGVRRPTPIPHELREALEAAASGADSVPSADASSERVA